MALTQKIFYNIPRMIHSLVEDNLKRMSRFTSLMPIQQQLLLAKCFETTQLAMVTVILENLDPNTDGDKVRSFVNNKDFDGLWLYAIEKIPNLENKLKPSIEQIAADLLKEI